METASLIKYFREMKPLQFATLAFAAAFLLYLIPLAANDYPLRDVAFRYAPMAESFAHGDFRYAFHPRVQMLLPFSGGVFAWLFQCDGFTGVKLATLLFFAASVFPLYGICRRLFTPDIAKWCVILHIFFSRLSRYSYSGTRETLKCFVILLLVYALLRIWQERREVTGYLLAGIGGGLAVCCRNDMILFTALLFLAAGVFECSKTMFFWRSALVMQFTALVFALPELFINYRLCGLFVPGNRFIPLFENAFGCQPTLWNMLLYAIPASFAGYTGVVYLLHFLWKYKAGCRLLFCGIPLILILVLVHTVSGKFSCTGEMVQNYIISLLQGNAYILLPFILLSIFLRLRSGQWSRAETIVLSCLIVHQLAVMLQIICHDHYLYVSDRYLIPATPLMFGWAILGVLSAWKMLAPFLPGALVKPLAFCLICVSVTGFYTDAVKGVVKDRRAESYQVMKIWGDIIKSDYTGEKISQEPFLLKEYVSGRHPRIYFNSESKLHVAAWYAGGFPCKTAAAADYAVLLAHRSPRGFKRIGPEIQYRERRFQIWKKIR